MRLSHRGALGAASFLLVGASALAQAPRGTGAPPDLGVGAQVELHVPEGARAGRDFDVERATRAWLDTLTPEERSRSDAYFEGGYWLQLWGFLYGVGVAGLLLFSRLSAWLRNRTRWTRWLSLNAGFYGAGYVVLTTLLTVPWALYTDFFREHQYGLSNLSLAGWLGEWGKGLGVSVVLGVIAFIPLYAVFRRAPRTWWMWGTGLAVAFFAFVIMIAPVFILPLFNDYRPLPPGPIRSEILGLARANDIPADDVYWFNASKQQKHISANVAGFGPTVRVALNDNLLMQGSNEAIEAVMGHEMGHYVLHHVYKGLVDAAVLLFVGFGFVFWAFRRLAARYGERWSVDGIEDPAAFPVIAVLFAAYFFVLTPLTNTITRTMEMEADLYGLNASGQPDGFASAAMKVATYRKIEPSYWEEILLYDHPSGRTRVHTAMQWKAEHLPGSRLGGPPFAEPATGSGPQPRSRP
jgi:STE24 endopeptidase